MKIIHLAAAATLGAGLTLSTSAQQPDPSTTTTATTASPSPANSAATAKPAATVSPKNADKMERWDRRREHRQDHRRDFGGNNRNGTLAEQEAGRRANHQERRQMRRAGETDQAIRLIERLLKTPGAVDSVNYSITLNDLRHRWEWDPLRNDPLFQKLLGAPNEP